MANLKEYQTKISTSRLYRIKPAPIRQPLKVWITNQGSDSEIKIYIAEDGATPDTLPASLAEMAVIATSNSIFDGAKAFENLTSNFIAVEQVAGTGNITINGIEIVADEGAIS